MKTIIKKKKTVLKMLGLIFILTVTLFISGCAKENEKSTIKRLYDITIPEEATVSYSFKDRTFTGVAFQYMVFTFEEVPRLFFKDYTFSDKKLEEKENEILNYVEMLEIPNEHQPNFEKSYLIYEKDNLILLYFTTSRKLISLIVGH